MVIFMRKTLFSVSFSFFQICYMTVFAMRTGFPFLLSWYKRKGNEKKKSRLRLRAYSGKAVLALKYELASLHYAQTAFFQRRPAIPTLTPLRLGQSLFHAKALRCWLLDLWFYNATVSTPALIHFAVGFDGILFLVQLSWVYRIENSAFSHGILYT